MNPKQFHLGKDGHTIDTRIRSLYYKYRHTGFELLRKIPRDAKILDIGCGTNMWKPYFDDLYGIDPYNEAADEMIKFEDYTPHKEFDTFLVLGSINFYNKEYVEMQIKHLSKITKSGDVIFWRQNTGKRLRRNDIKNMGVNNWTPGGNALKSTSNVEYFPWSIEHNKYFTDRYGFDLVEFKVDSVPVLDNDGKKNPKRYYAKWSKK